MGNEGEKGDGALIIGPDALWARRDRRAQYEMREKRDEARRRGQNAAAVGEKKHQEAVLAEWQRAHDAAATLLHEREVYFRDHIKTARHLGENRVIIRAKEHARSLQARSRTESPFSNLFKDCGSDVQYAGVAQAIEHWLAGQSEKLGNVWVEYDGKTIPDIQSYEQKQARMDAEMAIVWRKE